MTKMEFSNILPVYWNLFDRYAELEFKLEGGKILKLSNTDIDFDAQVSLDDTNNSNKATINIYNLPIGLKDKLKKDTVLQITAGYNDGTDRVKDQGIVFLGVIEKIKDTKDDVTINTEIQCSEANDIYQEIEFDITVSKGIKASTIIDTIIKKINESKTLDKDKKISKGIIKLGVDLVYERGKTFKNNLKNILGRLAIDTHSCFYITKKVLYFCPESNSIKDTIFCDNSKIISISDTDMGYSIEMFFDHRMEEGLGLIIEVEKTRFNDELSRKQDNYKITSVEHSINTRDGDHTTTIEIECKTRVEAKEMKEKKEKEDEGKDKTIKFKI